MNEMRVGGQLVDDVQVDNSRRVLAEWRMKSWLFWNITMLLQL
jgi:hypothetical protein